MKAHVGLGGEIRVFAERRIKAESDFLFVGNGGTHGGVPGRTGFNGVAGFQNVETVVRIVRQQGFQRLYDILFRPGFVLPADKCPAAATAHQHAFADQLRQRFA